MKIAYCIHSTYNSGGMERVISQKANFLAEEYNYDVYIITTEQQERPSYFNFSDKINFVDIDINYESTNSFVRKFFSYIKKKRLHKKRLSQVLSSLKVDVCISTFGNETSFICDIKDGSKKILEIHFSKFFRIQMERSGLWRLVDHVRSLQDERVIHKFDRFIVLTQEDKEHWKGLKNIDIIPNPAPDVVVGISANLSSNVVIAVGRYSFQKGFDMLIQAWEIVTQSISGWKLKIVGDGELREQLNTQIERLGLRSSIELMKPNKNIHEEYLSSSIYALSSRYEGLPMVLLEAMSYGLPIVSFKCKCGPRDLITDKIEGLLVDEMDIALFADSLLRLMKDQSNRENMSTKGQERAKDFSIVKIMECWNNLFISVM